MKCEHFNFCSKCEENIEHEHNMLKMRFVEEEERKEEKEDKEEGEERKDELFCMTKKCFKMSKTFGGKLEDYRELVESHKGMKVWELSSLYRKENSKAKFSEQFEDKLGEKCEKLSFYFNKPKEAFTELTKNHPSLSFKQLIKLVKEENLEAERKQEELKTEADEQIEVKLVTKTEEVTEKKE